ncbi:hypothetical protein OB905_00440 [Halobacteria archaeon AArc-dxtr1]|nr:hypothetical protein [Halobacteria archaeon AArc-dxtr1]
MCDNSRQAETTVGENRRRVLKGIGATGTMGLVAGCLSWMDAESDENDDDGSKANGNGTDIEWLTVTSGETETLSATELKAITGVTLERASSMTFERGATLRVES